MIRRPLVSETGLTLLRFNVIVKSRKLAYPQPPMRDFYAEAAPARARQSMMISRRGLAEDVIKSTFLPGCIRASVWQLSKFRSAKKAFRFAAHGRGPQKVVVSLCRETGR